MANVKKEILKVIKLKPEEDEDRQDFLKRVVEAINTLSDDEYGALSEAAQNWGNAATKAVEKEKTIPDFPEEAAAAPPKRVKATAKKEAEKEEPEEEEEAEGEEEETEEEEPEEEEAEGEEEETEEEEPEEEEEAPVAAKKKKKDAKEDKPAPRKRGDVSDGNLSPVMFVREHFLQNPDIEIEAIQKIVKKRYDKELSTATLNSLRNDYRSWMRLLKKHKYLSKSAPGYSA